MVTTLQRQTSSAVQAADRRHCRAVFVLPGRTPTQLEQLRQLNVDDDWQAFRGGVSAWIVQTFLMLKAKGLNVELSGSFQSDAVNIAHNTDLARHGHPRGCLLVGVRADYPSNRRCQLQIVQNKAQLGRKSVWMPHWPQPGLVARDDARGSRFERIAYLGRRVNHYSRFFRRASGYILIESAVQGIANRLGLELVERGPERWNDFSDVDAVIGLRDFGAKSYDTKPATKLVNAWLAGVPFIGGADSAFAQVGRPGVDYLRATTAPELEKALLRLRADRVLCETIVREGRNAVVANDKQAISDRWLDVLNTFPGRQNAMRARQCQNI